MKDLRLENELHQEEVASAQRNIQSEEADLKKIEQDVADAEKDEERLEKRMRKMMDEKRKLEEKLELELAKNQKYVQENQQRELAVRARRDEIQQHNAEQDKIQKMYDALKKKDKSLEDERKEL